MGKLEAFKGRITWFRERRTRARHITRDGQDVYSWKLKAIVKVFGPLARLTRLADLDDQVEA